MDEISEREYVLLDALYSGRARETRYIVDGSSLRSLINKGLVFLKEGPPRPPRNSADFTKLIRRGLTHGMITHEEAHLSRAGLRAYRERQLKRQKGRT